MFDVPEAYLACIGVGLVLSLAALLRTPNVRLRAAVFILGQTVLLTAPLAVFLDTWMYGSYPTIDKAGSMVFYLDGVHLRMLTDPVASLQDPAARLIGVHVGHLWVPSSSTCSSPLWGRSMRRVCSTRPRMVLRVASVSRSDAEAARQHAHGLPFGMGLRLRTQLVHRRPQSSGFPYFCGPLTGRGVTADTGEPGLGSSWRSTWMMSTRNAQRHDACAGHARS